MKYAKFDVSEITFTEGRCYQKAVYSLPYEIRQFLYPESDSEGDFFEVDLTSAELTLAAWFYKDTVLTNDIQSGKFWEIWLTKYSDSSFTKSIMKKCLYCMSYSASDVTFPPQTPPNFYRDFTERYSVWWNGVVRTKYVYENRPLAFTGKYNNWVTGAPIPIPSPDEHHATFKLLNFRVQQSLSSYCQILYADVSKQAGVTPYLLNFDSLFVTYPGHTLEQFQSLVEECMRKLISEKKLPCMIPFKCCKGRNLAESQGWEGSDML